MLEAAKIQPEDRILEIGVGLVAAGGPSVPDPLRRQLAPGGRLVIPVGDADEQRLMRVTRIGKDGFVEDDLGTVRFVPLIGELGWPSRERRPDDETPAAIERRGFRRDDDSVKNGSWL